MSSPSWIGKQLGGRYRIDELLGQGGMSSVYKAYDPNLRRVVAIKLIHPHLASDPKFLIRFEEEATSVAQLRHSNIVQVFDFNHDGDLYYMVQEFIPGETVQERLRRLSRSGKRMPIDEAARYTINICEATDYAHRRGMIHRDIKPANIMIDMQGQAILMDFGIVKIVGGEQHTATGAVVGTARYLSPEMIRGEAPDGRADMYSLGVTLFEMVNGRPPFEADSAMTLMMMHLNDPLPDLRQLQPDVPVDLVGVIEKSLAKDRSKRYASMVEMAAGLRNIRGGAMGTSPGQMTGTAPILPGSFSPPQSLAADGATVAGATIPGSAPSQATVAGYAGIGTQVAPSSMGGPPPSNPPTLAATMAVPAPAASPTISPYAPSTGQTQQAGGPPPASYAGVSTPASGSSAGKKTLPLIWIGGAVGLVALIVIGFLAYLAISGRGQSPAAITDQGATETEQARAIAVATNTPSPSPIIGLTPTVTPTITFTLPPAATFTPTLSPTPTIPVGIPYVRINGITVDNQGRYIVDYETFEYTEKLPGVHVHFFFNTVLPDQAGSPGSGPWILYGGPRPFDKYKTSDRPKVATQMCALVANANHSIQPNSGNCVILPDIVVVAPGEDSACLAGPDPGFPTLLTIPAGQILLVNGMSPDENWWNVMNPSDPRESCWLPRQSTSLSGDISTLPMIEGPVLPAGTQAPVFSVSITGITLDAQNRYVVEYVTQGYTEKIPGTHIHFFFSTVSHEFGGTVDDPNRKMHGGPNPFTAFTAAERPADALFLCALVANPDHTVIPNSGACMNLPGV